MRLVHLVAPLLLVLVTAPPVRGDDAPLQAPAQSQASARDAYAQGMKLHKQGDYREAARAFARADEIAPSPVALRAALDEALLAGDPVLAMTLADKASRDPSDATLRDRAAAARARFADATGRVTITCGGADRCLASVDGVSATIGPQWVRTGQHTIVIQVGDEAQQRLVDVRAGSSPAAPVSFKPKGAAVVAADPPPAPPRAPAPAPTTATAPARREFATDEPARANPDVAPARTGIAPTFFFVGAALTAVVGAGTIVSGLDTKNLRQDFVDRKCDAADGPGCADLASRGTDAKTRTNVLAASTAIVGVATAAIGIFLVRWSSPSSSPKQAHDRGAPSVTATLSVTASGAALDGSF